MRGITDKPREACGVFGIYAPDGEAAALTYMGLYALQHRGQESAGITVSDGEKLQLYKDEGLVPEVFSEEILEGLPGFLAIGHVHYPTWGNTGYLNAQPLLVHSRKGSLALAHNGNLVNAAALRAQLEEQGAVFQTAVDAEVIASLLARNDREGIVAALVDCMQVFRGSYALVLLTRDRLIGARDPHGLRPLSLGTLPGGGYVLTSETCALDTIGASFLRDVEPGEVVVVEGGQLHSLQGTKPLGRALCAFEFIYFARPDSVIDGMNVHLARNRAGERLAQEHPVEADLVIAVPDSGTSAAIGYARAAGIPFGEGMIKNRYVGRTFISPGRKARERRVQLKLNPISTVVKGKRVVVVDDSIVRGTTSHRIVKLLRKAGAQEVHVRVSSPPVVSPCYFGISTPAYEELVGAQNRVAAIEQRIGADSLGFLSLEGLVESIGMGEENLCLGCFTGRYPVTVDNGQLTMNN